MRELYPSLKAYIVRGSVAGMVALLMFIALLCQACGTERKAIAYEKKNNGWGLQKQRSNAEKRRTNDYYNGKQHERYVKD